MNALVLKVCTVPCTEAGRAIYRLGDLSDDGVYKAMMHLQHQKNGTESLPLNQQKIVAIAAVLVSGDAVQTTILGDENSTEVDLLVQLSEILARSPTLVSWNGGELDLPVIGYRLLKHGIACSTFWERDSFEESCLQTLDLMDVLSAYNNTVGVSLSEMAEVLGLAGDMGLQSMDVLAQYQEGNLVGIRQACEIDALNTYLIYLKYLRTRGDLSEIAYSSQSTQLQRQVIQSTLSHLKQFAAACWAEQQ